MDRNSIRNVVYSAIDEVNSQLDSTQQLAKSEETPLLAKEGTLDSLGLVNLIVQVEQEIDDRFGVPVTLADEKAMSRKTSPFRSVGTLVEYISEVLKEKCDA